jgi:hypothetical protein
MTCARKSAKSKKPVEFVCLVIVEPPVKEEGGMWGDFSYVPGDFTNSNYWPQATTEKEAVKFFRKNHSKPCRLTRDLAADMFGLTRRQLNRF